LIFIVTEARIGFISGQHFGFVRGFGVNMPLLLKRCFNVENCQHWHCSLPHLPRTGLWPGRAKSCFAA